MNGWSCLKRVGVLWLLVQGCAGTLFAATPEALPASPSEAVADIARRWVGSFDNHLQVRAHLDRSGPDVPELGRERRQFKAVMLAAPQLGETVIYFEEFRASAPDKAYRQRIVALSYDAARQQIRGRQLFFKGAQHGRDVLDPASVDKMPLSDFDVSRPGCDLWFRWEGKYQRYRGGMDPRACVSRDASAGGLHVEYEMLLYGSELWYRDRTTFIADGRVRAELNGFNWIMLTRSGQPHIAEQQGVWHGTFRRYDAEGKLTAEFPSQITMRVIPRDGRLDYHQTNRYYPAGKPAEILESYGEVRDGRIYFGNARLDGWKMDVPDDPTLRSAVILLNYKDGSGLYAHEIVSVSSDGRFRARATQYLKDGKVVRRTLIDEEKVTSDWAADDARRSAK